MASVYNNITVHTPLQSTMVLRVKMECYSFENFNNRLQTWHVIPHNDEWLLPKPNNTASSSSLSVIYPSNFYLGLFTVDFNHVTLVSLIEGSFITRSLVNMKNM